MAVNLYAAWIGFAFGCVVGAVTGLFFHERHWLGGYPSWPRRLIRLGHISFFGIGLLNLAFALTARAVGVDAGLTAASNLFLLGAVTMPLVCYLSAWRVTFRHLFFIPALSITCGVVLFTWRLLAP